MYCSISLPYLLSCPAAAGADVHLADPNTGNAAQMAAAVGHIEVVEKLVEAGCPWPHGKKANTGLGAPVDVVQLLSQKTGMVVSRQKIVMQSEDLHPCMHSYPGIVWS